MKANWNKLNKVVWVKLDGTVTDGILTSNLIFVPEELRPVAPMKPTRGYKRLFCVRRNSWIGLYTKNILKV